MTAFVVLLLVSSLSVAQDIDDRSAILRLRAEDVEATKRFDIDRLMSLWSDEIVSMPPGGSPIIGRAANVQFLIKARSQGEATEFIAYQQDWRELQIAGVHAFEWGVFTSTVRMRATGAIVRQQHNVLRILRREGSRWVILRTTWNEHRTPK